MSQCKPNLKKAPTKVYLAYRAKGIDNDVADFDKATGDVYMRIITRPERVPWTIAEPSGEGEPRRVAEGWKATIPGEAAGRPVWLE